MSSVSIGRLLRDRTTTSSLFRPKRESARFESTDCLMRWPGASWRNPCATQCTRLIRLERWSLKWLRVNSKAGTIEGLMQMAARCSPIRHEAEDLVHDVLLAAIEKGPRLRRFKGSRKGHPGQNGPVAIWLLAPSPKSVAGSRFFVLYQKTGVESVTQEGAAIWAAITNIKNAWETTMTTPTPLLTSSGSCPWPFPWPVHPPACPGNGSVA